MPLLARDFTVYAPEHPGTAAGDPDAIKPLEDIWDLTLYYYEMFDQLGLEAPAVVGHSFGGMIAGEIAATDPTASRQLHELGCALAQISEEQRQVILLVGLEGMRYEEVAEVMHVPIGTVRSRLHRARIELRQLLQREED